MKIDRFVDVAAPIFGDGCEVPSSENLFALATELVDKENQPRLYMGVGKDDFLYADNQKLREHIESLGLDLTYREGEGIHSWIFWDEHIRYVLEWAFKK
jgi:S-formylglutathione hydrolase FrmB